MWSLISFYGQLDSTSLSARSIQMLRTEIVLTGVQNLFFFLIKDLTKSSLSKCCVHKFTLIKGNIMAKQTIDLPYDICQWILLRQQVNILLLKEAGDSIMTEWLVPVPHSRKVLGSIPGLCRAFCVEFHVSLPMSEWVCLQFPASTQNMQGGRISQPGHSNHQPGSTSGDAAL